ncbi:hypothetical protein [Ornithinibacillus bavariensis]|uniref:hypothetical protein n=1 Tax=Ornithinibacillus bavariensis TaxID=545502 RepID=UPI00278BBDAD|nr:hypothetical protein [Ornithinibacillus bavariensis]
MQSGSIARIPEKPDPNQTAVIWLPLSQIEDIQLYANIGKEIQDYTLKKRSIDLIEEHKL